MTRRVLYYIVFFLFILRRCQYLRLYTGGVTITRRRLMTSDLEGSRRDTTAVLSPSHYSPDFNTRFS